MTDTTQTGIRHRDGQLREIRWTNQGNMATHMDMNPAFVITILTEWYYNIVGIYMYRNQFYALNQDANGAVTVYHIEFPLVISEQTMTDHLPFTKAQLQEIYTRSAMYYGYPSETEIFEYGDDVYVLYWHEDRVTIYTAPGVTRHD
jgi:hypothetical protein